MQKGKKLIVEFLVKVLFGFYSNSIPLLQTLVLISHESINRLRFSNSLLIYLQLATMILVFLILVHHFVVDLVRKAVFEQRH